MPCARTTSAWVFASVHGVLSALWFLLVFIYNDRAVWFLSGGVGFKDATTGILFTLAAVAGVLHKAAGRTVLRWLYLVVVVFALLTLAGLGAYAYMLASAIQHPDDMPQPYTRQMAKDMWNNDASSAGPNGRAVTILVMIMLAGTGALHLGTAVWAAVVLARLCRAGDDDDVNDAGDGNATPPAAAMKHGGMVPLLGLPSYA
jgi:hypothetical protein